jgi:CheY-like chemotaxis protein
MPAGVNNTMKRNHNMANVTNLRPVPETKRRVLIVEDNLDSVHSMAMLVKAMGHQCEFAINGFAALDIARKFRPDVILLDIGLPDHCDNRSTAARGPGTSA